MGNHNLGDMSSTSRIELFPSDFTLSGGVYGCGEGNTLIQLKTIDDGSAINSQQSYSWGNKLIPFNTIDDSEKYNILLRSEKVSLEQ